MTVERTYKGKQFNDLTHKEAIECLHRIADSVEILESITGAIENGKNEKRRSNCKA